MHDILISGGVQPGRGRRGCYDADGVHFHYRLTPPTCYQLSSPPFMPPTRSPTLNLLAPPHPTLACSATSWLLVASISSDWYARAMRRCSQ